MDNIINFYGCFIMLWIIPVSYTHLDVYKRQAQTPTGGSSREFSAMGETLTEQRRVKEEVDVYKRQQ